MSIYSERRKEFMDKMDGGVAVFFAAPERNKNSDVDYRYRQESSFYFLTGFHEPESILVLAPENKDFQTAIFCRERDPKMEQWMGRRLGVERAASKLEVDRAFAFADFKKEMPKIMENNKKVYFDFYSEEDHKELVADCAKAANRLNRHSFGPTIFEHVSEIIGAMRLIKKETERNLLYEAAKINTTAHRAAMAFTAPGKNEYEVHALLNFIYQKHGAWGEAYGSIVASGDNANILHYVENNAVMKDGDLLLIDAGPEYDLFASDVTRTFPVNGKFTSAQKTIYELVLKSQKEAIAMVKPGCSNQDIHEHVTKVLTQGLIDLGILKGSLEENLKERTFFKWYPHSTGHWLGMDVHDIGPYHGEDLKSPRKFEAGMCFTIEPGLYFPMGCHESDGIPKEFEGIGIRIEDDILVTNSGFENITGDIPKEIKDIEAACALELDLNKV